MADPVVSAYPADAVYATEEAELPADSDDEFNYSEIPLENMVTEDAESESFSDTLQRVKNAKVMATKELPSKPRLNDRPEVVEDYLRNFLLKAGMARTLSTFQSEWYELVQKGIVNENVSEAIPDCYSSNNQLLEQIEVLGTEKEAIMSAAQKADRVLAKMKKERDFHRLAHRRIKQDTQEKDREIERLHTHYNGIIAENEELQKKYTITKRRGVEATLARDNAERTVLSLTTQLDTITQQPAEEVSSAPTAPEELPQQRAANATMAAQQSPIALLSFRECTNPLTPARAKSLEVKGTFQAHGEAISSLSYHPTEKMLATTSDDCSFKVWELDENANCTMLLEGKGHTSWVGSCDFSPHGAAKTHLVTGAGDATVKVWDLETAECAATFSEHTHAVWGVAFHYTGDFVASCSLDNTARLWDLHALRCRSSFRGHDDSVNSVAFQDLSNTFVTASADTTVMLWDARSGLAGLTMRGHENAVNSAVFNRSGDRVASVDADGIVCLWEVRTGTQLQWYNAGPEPATSCAFDPSGQVLTVGSAGSEIKLLDADTLAPILSLEGNHGAVQTLEFEPTGKYLISGLSDGTVQLWQ